MISFDTFLLGLMVISTITGLATEAIKKIFTEHDVKYHANTLAGVVAMILSVAIGLGYVVIAEIDFSAKIIVYLVALVLSSWLCAMVGYDKVIGMIKPTKKD